MGKIRNFLLLIALACPALPAPASELDVVTGVVIDESTGRLVPDALVILLQDFRYPYPFRNTCFNHPVTYTDKEGRFRYQGLSDRIPKNPKRSANIPPPEEVVAAAIFKDGLMMPVTSDSHFVWARFDPVLMGGPLPESGTREYEIIAHLSPMSLSPTDQVHYYRRILYTFGECKNSQLLAPVAKAVFPTALMNAHTEDDIREAYRIGMEAMMYDWPDLKISLYKMPIALQHAMIEAYLGNNMEKMLNYRRVRIGLVRTDTLNEQELVDIIRDPDRFDPAVTDGTDINYHQHPLEFHDNPDFRVNDLLEWAVKREYPQALLALLARGYTVRNKMGGILVVRSISARRLDITRILLEHGAPLVDKFSRYHTDAMTHAITENNVEAIDLILKLRPDYKKQLPDIFSTRLLLGEGDKAIGRETLKALFHHGVSPDAIDASGYTGARLAIKRGDMKELQWFLDQGARLDYIPPRQAGRSVSTASPLILAMRSDNLQIVRFVADRLPPPSSEERDLPPIAAAVNPAILQELLSRGYRLSQKYYAAKLEEYASKNDIAASRELLENQDLGDGVFHIGTATYHFINAAASNRQLELLRLYTEHGFKPSPDGRTLQYGNVPLGIFAAGNGDFEILEHLLDHKLIPIDSVDNYGIDMLSYVSDTGRANALLKSREYREQAEKRRQERIKECGKPTCKGYNEASVVMIHIQNPAPVAPARRKLQFRLIDRLLTAGRDINYRDRHFGYTALMRATYIGDSTVAQYLYKKGARLDIRNRAGETALDIARARKLPGMIAFLENPDQPILGDGIDIPADLDVRLALATAIDSGNYDTMVRIVKEFPGELPDPLFYGLRPLTPEAVRRLTRAGFSLEQIYPVSKMSDKKIYRIVDEADQLHKEELLAVFLDLGMNLPGLAYNAVDVQNARILELILDRLPEPEKKGALPPLYTAIGKDKDIGILALLLQHGADTAITDARGNTMIELAREAGREDMVSLLSKAQKSRKSEEPKQSLFDWIRRKVRSLSE